MNQTKDSEAYLNKKQFFNQLLTIYGRKPVLEALEDQHTKVYRLHLADKNKPAAIMSDIIRLAENKGAEVVYHDRKSLSRISKNSKQDQGVAVDLICKGYQDYKDFLIQHQDQPFDIIALDRITNPQNLGMIIRSVCAGATTALLLPEQGCAKLDALVIKASAGVLFRASILRCNNLVEALADFKKADCDIYGLSSHATHQFSDVPAQGRNLFVLGNETDGVSKPVSDQCNKMLSIPMNNGVESLNVAVTASLIAYRTLLRIA